jgi:protein-arginine kinase activator protein McsA
MTSPAFPELPADLQARLDAAGVTDAATLAAALDADPALRREYQAFLLDALPAIPDEEQLRALWQMIPSKDEDAFLAAAEARAAAAETSGDAGLAAALRERIDALRAFQQEIARDSEILRQALERLEAATTDDDLAAVWRDVPLELEETFLNLVALQAEEHEQHGDAERAAHVRACHERFSAIQQQQRAGAETMRRLLEQLAADVEALAAAADHQGVADVWNRIPLELEEPFLQLTEHLAGELEQTDAATAARLREWIAALSQARVQRETARDMVRQALERLEAASSSDEAWQVWLDLPGDLEEWFLQAITERIEEVERDDTALAERLRAAHARMRAERNRRQERANHPVVQALRAFLDAATDADATRVFNEHKAILQPFEAQRELDDLAQQAPDEQRAAIAARAALLRRLRGGDPAPRPTPAAVTPAETRRGTPGSIVYINSAVVEGGSGTAIVYNNIVMERRWLRPRPERLSIDTIERTRDLEQVARIITERGQLAITGGTRTATAAVQGMPGIGKTVLARQLALALNDRYPGGVIWEEIGPEIRAPEDTQPILNRWARYALTVPPHLDNQLAFDAGAVRALFAAQGQPLLVILDNVWSLEGIRWLRAALPENAHLVITTRLETVMIGLGGGEYVLGLLTPDEARALIALRLNWPELPADHYDWADALAVGVGYHTLALDVAIRRLRLDARSPGAPRWREQVNRLLDHIRSGRGFERLALPDSERNQNVEAVLAYSYDRMDDTARARVFVCWAYLRRKRPSAATRRRRCGSVMWNRRMICSAHLPAPRCWKPATLAAGASIACCAATHWRCCGAKANMTPLPRAMPLSMPPPCAPPTMRSASTTCWATTRNSGTPSPGRSRTTWNWRWIWLPTPRTCKKRMAMAATTWPGLSRRSPQRNSAARRRRSRAPRYRWGMPCNTPLVCRARIAARGCAKRWRPMMRPCAFTPPKPCRSITPTQNNRAVLLRDLASVPGEDRGARLREALAAYDAALRIYTAETVPLDYAATQNNRAVLLSDLASVPGEDRGARLREALAAYDAALRYRTPETVPLAYAATQNNRANLLRDLASVPGEDRGARLREALAAYDAALRIYTAETVPLDYAATQNNRANLLRDLASVPGEDRGARLREALAAYDAALRIYTAETVPLDYAMTQNNRAVLLSDLASVPGEDRGARLREALRCALTAVELYARLQHEQYYQVSRRTLQGVRAACGDDFDTLWAALDVGPPPEWLIAPEEGEALSLPPELQARLAAAGVTDEASFLAALAADPELRAGVEAFVAQQQQALLSQLVQRLLAVSSGDELLAFWRELPAELEEPLAAAAEEAARQAGQSGDVALAQALRERAAGLRAIRAAADAAQSKIQQAWQHYIELVEAAEAAGNDIAAWRAAVEVGEALLAPEFADVLGIGDAMREHVASTWNALGNALHDAGDGEAAVAAYDRAIALQPDQAMWRRNRVATLIDLGRRAEAAEELARARALEPDAARLTELEARLRDEG